MSRDGILVDDKNRNDLDFSPGGSVSPHILLFFAFLWRFLADRLGGLSTLLGSGRIMKQTHLGADIT
jgi:hypothetical protein